ncbi:MAG: hypothetical protein RIM72_00675 [Alphaproteobacteria bacterium]
MSIDPVSLALFGLNTASSIASAKAQQQTANRQASFAEQEAQRKRQLADINARRVATENRKARSRVLAGQTAAGADTGSGSALLVQQNLAAEDSLQQALTRLDGETAARSLEHQAQITRRNASELTSKAVFNAGTTLLEEFKGHYSFNVFS